MTSYILRISRITRIERFYSSHSGNFGRRALLKVDFDQNCHFSKKFCFHFHPGSHKYKDSRIAHSPVIMAGVLTTIWDKLRGHRTSATYSGPSPQVLAEQERMAKMPLEEKRKLYRCREHYKTLKDIPTWNEYFHKNITEKTKTNKGPKIEVSSALNDKVSIWQGDITQLEIDCIANAANSSLLGGGGVDGAIHAAAGSWLYKECKELNGCDTGDAKLTSGYNLPAKYVAHTVGPIGEKPNELKACYDNCLAFMKKSENSRNIASLALPCISTGVFGYPNYNAAEIAISKVRTFLEEHGEKVDRVIFCLFLNKDVVIYEQLMQTYFPVVDSEHPVTDPGGESKAVIEGETKETSKSEETTDQTVKASEPVPEAGNEKEKVDKSEESQSRGKNTQENNVLNEQENQETPVAQTVEMTDESMSQDTDIQNTDTQDNEAESQDMETHELPRSETVEMLSQEEEGVNKDTTDNIGNTGNMDCKADRKGAGDVENVNNSPIVSPEKKRRSSDEEQDSKL